MLLYYAISNDELTCVSHTQLGSTLDLAYLITNGCFSKQRDGRECQNFEGRTPHISPTHTALFQCIQNCSTVVL